MKTLQILLKVLTLNIVILTIYKSDVSAQITWKAESSSEVKFTIKNAGISVDGKFKTFTTNIIFDPENLNKSYIEGIINANSIDTGMGLRDKHLRDEEYFNVSKYPKIIFKSEQIFKYENKYIARGKLTIKDVTKEILLPIHFTPKEGDKAHFKSTLLLNRIHYNVGGKSLIMSDELTATLEIEATKQ